MNEQVEVVEDAPVYDAYEALTNTHSGVLCPNVECQDRIFSYEDGPATSCRCGITFVCGGFKYLKYGAGAPFRFEDVRVISQRLHDVDVAPIEELVEMANENDSECVSILDSIPADGTETAEEFIEELPSSDDLLEGPVSPDEVETI